MSTPETRAARRELIAKAIEEVAAAASAPVVTEHILERDPQILPLWARRAFYVIGTLAGAGALIVGGYDAELAKNIAGAGAILVASLALANPTR